VQLLYIGDYPGIFQLTQQQTMSVWCVSITLIHVPSEVKSTAIAEYLSAV